MENMVNLYNFKNTYKGKKILITGNTGFKGSWLSVWLKELGAKVYGLSIDIPSGNSMYNILNIEKKIETNFQDINNYDNLLDTINNIKPDFIFHLAAQAIVINSYLEPINTFETNVLGTVKLLEALRVLNIKTNVVVVTSDKCYENNEHLWSYRESDKLGGKDPYSASKGAAEIVFHSYVNSFFSHTNSNVKLTSARAGNVIGGGDWSEYRLVPDIINSLIANTQLEIRSPNATRPWQHVLEPLSAYLLLGQKLTEGNTINGQSFNFGPISEETFSVLDLYNEFIHLWHQDHTKINYLVTSNNYHEANFLKLSCDKANILLRWKPILNFKKTCNYTFNWYKSYLNKKEDIYAFTVNQITSFCNEKY